MQKWYDTAVWKFRYITKCNPQLCGEPRAQSPTASQLWSVSFKQFVNLSETNLGISTWRAQYALYEAISRLYPKFITCYAWYQDEFECHHRSKDCLRMVLAQVHNQANSIQSRFGPKIIFTCAPSSRNFWGADAIKVMKWWSDGCRQKRGWTGWRRRARTKA